MSKALLLGIAALLGSLLLLALERGGLLQQQARADAALQQAHYELQGLREAARIAGEQLAERDAIDRQRTHELKEAQDETSRLRAAVDAGRQRLRVNATCPAVRLPTDASATGLADAGAAELAADARQDYFALRDQLALSRQMLLGLQDYARTCQRARATPDLSPKRTTQ